MRRLLAMCMAAAVVVGACGDGGGAGNGNGNGNGNEGDPPAATGGSLSFHDGPPPWPLSQRQADRMAAAGLPALKAEGSVVHYHAHLDVFYDGDEVTVPANVGVDGPKQRISPLHTHSTSGVIHIEANEADDFTLGQVLTQWGVKAADGCIADKCGDEVALFINGSIQDVDPVELVIEADTQIALVLGTPPADIPSGYDCASNPDDACPEVSG